MSFKEKILIFCTYEAHQPTNVYCRNKRDLLSEHCQSLCGGQIEVYNTQMMRISSTKDFELPLTTYMVIPE